MIPRVEIRQAEPGDAHALERLAQLEGVDSPGDGMVVASVEGEVWAAVHVETGEAIADPFTSSGPLVEALRAISADSGSRRARARERIGRSGA